MARSSRCAAGLAVVLLAGGVAGCAQYEPHPLSASDGASAIRARALDAPGLRRFLAESLGTAPSAWPLARWDFEQLVLAAYYFQPALDVARERWGLARAARITAGQRPNPTLSVSPAFDSTTSVPSPWLVTVTLDVPIETAGKRAHRQDRAARLSEAARLRVLSIAWQVRSRIRAALVALETAQDSAAELRSLVDLETESLEVMGAQLDAGAVSRFDLTQARIRSQRTRLSLGEAEAEVGLARLRLAGALGVSARALEGIEVSFAGLEEPFNEASLAAARREAALRRPDLAAALAEYAAREAALRLEIAKQYPDVHLSPGYEFDQGDDKWSLGLQIELPVLHQNQGPIAEAEARRGEAAARFDALQTRVLAEVERAVAGYRAAHRQRVAADALRDALRQQARTAKARLEGGAISRLELLGLRLQLGAAELERLQVVARERRALGALEDAVQAPGRLPVALAEVVVRSPSDSAAASR